MGPIWAIHVAHLRCHVVYHSILELIDGGGWVEVVNELRAGTKWNLAPVVADIVYGVIFLDKDETILVVSSILECRNYERTEPHV